MGTLIDGKAISAAIKEEIATNVAALKSEKGIQPHLAVILVGDDPGSQIYVGIKERTSAAVGIKSTTHRLPGDSTMDDLLTLVRRLNNDPSVHGILCQLPLPKHLDEIPVIHAIAPSKDVDGIHPQTVGSYTALKKYSDIKSSGLFLPCTPHGIMELITRTGVTISGKNAVVIGRSNIVGKPISTLLMSADATVTIAHSRTSDLPAVCRRADILVAAIGIPRFVKGDWIKPGATVIDVGSNRTESGLCGDVDFDSALPVAAHITPSPGGVGPMTVAMLMQNTLTAAAMLRP